MILDPLPSRKQPDTTPKAQLFVDGRLYDSGDLTQLTARFYEELKKHSASVELRAQTTTKGPAKWRTVLKRAL